MLGRRAVWQGRQTGAGLLLGWIHQELQQSWNQRRPGPAQLHRLREPGLHIGLHRWPCAGKRAGPMGRSSGEAAPTQAAGTLGVPQGVCRTATGAEAPAAARHRAASAPGQPGGSSLATYFAPETRRFGRRCRLRPEASGAPSWPVSELNRAAGEESRKQKKRQAGRGGSVGERLHSHFSQDPSVQKSCKRLSWLAVAFDAGLVGLRRAPGHPSLRAEHRGSGGVIALQPLRGLGLCRLAADCWPFPSSPAGATAQHARSLPSRDCGSAQSCAGTLSPWAEAKRLQLLL